MIPIEKNIQVVDEQGNYYEATYPKRAKGLVKKGRARFIEENVICLACPPSNILEDGTMTEAKENTQAAVENTVEMISENKNYTIDYVLQQIENIASQTDYLNKAITQLSKVTSNGPGDVGAQGVSNSLGQIVMCRETTNQRLIAFYEKMYDDLKPNNTTKELALEMMLSISKNAECSEDGLAAMSDIMNAIRHM